MWEPLESELDTPAGVERGDLGCINWNVDLASEDPGRTARHERWYGWGQAHQGYHQGELLKPRHRVPLL